MRTAAAESERRANKVGAVIASFETLSDIADHAIAADALPTRRPQADRLPERGADHPFTAKGNRTDMHDGIRLPFDEVTPYRAGLDRRKLQTRSWPARAAFHPNLRLTQ